MSPELKTEFPNIEWRLIAGLRDRLTHCYDDVSWKIVWDVLKSDIPLLKVEMQKIREEKKW